MVKQKEVVHLECLRKGLILNNYCVYRHIRLDTNEVFYIGVGNLKRPYSLKSRNKYWNNITNITNYEIQILTKNLFREEACELEIILINYYGRKCNDTGKLCNVSKGGDTWDKTHMSDIQKEKISITHKNKIITKESKLKMSKAKEGMYLLDNNPNSKKVINILTNQIFNTVKEASLFENKNYSTFKWSLKHKLNFNYKYYI